MEETSSNLLTVVYALDYSKPYSGVWIYGVYEDGVVAYKTQQQLQESEEYKHLTWSNNVLKLNK